MRRFLFCLCLIPVGLFVIQCRVAADVPCQPGDPDCEAFSSLLLNMDASVLACNGFDWYNTTAACWETIQSLLVTEQSRGDCGAPTTRLIGDVFAVTQKWSSGVLAPSGIIRGISQNEPQFLKIDPAAGTAAAAGTATAATGWRGGVLAPSGKIIGINSNAGGTIVEYDDNTESSNDFTAVASVGNAQRGGVLAPNGFIYAIPGANTDVIKIDPINRTGTAITVGTGGWQGATLGPNGLIYAASNSAGSILVIDPASDTVRTIGSGINGYTGVVLAPNGKLYFIPSSATSVLVLDPYTETTYTFGSLPGGVEDWVHGALAANGKIYAPPGSSTNTVLVIDTITDTVAQISTGTTLAHRWWGAVSAFNDKVYAIPFDADQVLEIDPCANGKIVSNILLGPYYNKW